MHRNNRFTRLLLPDEFYLKGAASDSGRSIHGEYAQIENGDWLIASLRDEFNAASPADRRERAVTEKFPPRTAMRVSFLSSL